MVEQVGADFQRVCEFDRIELWLADAVPVFHGSFEVAFEKADSAEKVVGVVVFWVEAQGTMQPGRSFGVAILFEGDSGKFFAEALVFWVGVIAGEQGALGVVPSFQMG